MKKISVDFKKNENNDYIIERVNINNACLSENSKCLYCPFYTGTKCHGHGDYWGTCTIYNYVNKDYKYYDNIVDDNSKCKVYQYLKSLDNED